MPGILRAKVGGAWVDISMSGPQGVAGPVGPAGPLSDEVFIGTVEPVDPTLELWYNPDADLSYAMGPQGAQGAPGPQGTPGFQGNQGFQGATGPAPAGTGIVAVSAGVLGTPGQLTGDITTTGAGLAATIGAKKVQNTMLRDSIPLSLIGRAGDTTGNPGDIQFLLDGQVAQRFGNALVAQYPYLPSGVAYAEQWNINSANNVWASVPVFGITVPVGGTFLVWATTRLAAQASGPHGLVYVRMLLNGVPIPGSGSLPLYTFGTALAFWTVTTMVPSLAIVPGSVLQVQVLRQDNGVSWTTLQLCSDGNAYSSIGYLRTGP